MIAHYMLFITYKQMLYKNMVEIYQMTSDTYLLRITNTPHRMNVIATSNHPLKMNLQ